MDIPSDWGISSSFNVSDLVEFHENDDIPNEMFSSLAPLESEDHLNLSSFSVNFIFRIVD